MRVTKIIYRESDNIAKAITVCDVVLEDSIKLVGVRLYRNKAGYYLVFPSKQDLYLDIKALNEDSNINFPKEPNGTDGEKKNYEEYFYPMSSAFYSQLLNEVVLGFESKKASGSKCYIP